MMRCWGDRQKSYGDVCLLFNQTMRNENSSISKSTVERTVKRFEDTGSVKDRPKSGRPVSAIGDEKQLDIALSFVEDPHLTVRKAVQQHSVSVGSMHNILKKKLKFHPFKVHLVQELSEDDFDRRLEFSEIMMTRIDANPNFLYEIIFSDEATFALNGNVNRHNCRFWSNSNPR